MRATVLTRDELTGEDVEEFWQQNVDMDDWDYIVLAPVETIEEEVEKWHEYDWNKGREVERERTAWTQKEYALDRLLTGCCHNEWYKATFRGEVYAVGVAYHA